MRINKFTLVSAVLLLCSSHAIAELWMTDGSTVIFEDTVKIEEAMAPEDIFGSQPYEGAVDTDVNLGDFTAPADDSFYVSVEAEWVVILPDNVVAPVTTSTPVKLQGMMDGKYFSAFLENQTNWIPASIGNNLIASGPGIETTLGDLITGNIAASIDIYYQDKSGKDRFFTSDSTSLANLQIIELINGVLNRYPNVRYVNLGALESSSAFVNDEGIRTTAIVKSLAELPFSGLPLTIESLKQLTLKNISKIIINFRKYMKQDAVILVTDQHGNRVGEGIFNLQ